MARKPTPAATHTEMMQQQAAAGMASAPTNEIGTGIGNQAHLEQTVGTGQANAASAQSSGRR